VRFAVISGSREWTEATPERISAQRPVDVEDVHFEARRRVREFVTGTPMPDSIRHIAAQIEFAAQAIGRLSPIPLDYADDVYWPRVW
jgi:sulfur relay (sulfurtransferase) DsrC/TusE family protein